MSAAVEQKICLCCRMLQPQSRFEVSESRNKVSESHKEAAQALCDVAASQFEVPVQMDAADTLN